MKRKIKEGDLAPAIQANDLWGKAVSVPANDNWVYLSFHRFAACPFCNLRTNELIRHSNAFKKQNVEIVSIWPSNEDSLLRYAGSEKPPFTMLSDTEKSIYKAYGVTQSSLMGALRLMFHPSLILDALKKVRKNIEVDADPMLMPAGFLVDREGIVKMAYYGRHFGDHPAIETILLLRQQTSGR